MRSAVRCFGSASAICGLNLSRKWLNAATGFSFLPVATLLRAWVLTVFSPRGVENYFCFFRRSTRISFVRQYCAKISGAPSLSAF